MILYNCDYSILSIICFNANRGVLGKVRIMNGLNNVISTKNRLAPCFRAYSDLSSTKIIHNNHCTPIIQMKNNKNEPVTIKESLSLIGKGILKEFKNIFYYHPIKSLAMAGLGLLAIATVGTIIAPFLAVGAVTGIAIAGSLFALGFGGLSLYNTSKTIAMLLKDYQKGDFRNLRKNLENLGSDLAGVALSAPFIPKGLSLLKNVARNLKNNAKIATGNLKPTDIAIKDQQVLEIRPQPIDFVKPNKQIFFKRSPDLPGGQLVAEYLAENGLKTRKFAIMEGEEALEGFFVNGKPVQVKVYDFQSGEIKVAHVQHGSKYGVVGWEKIKGSAEPDIILMCHPETLTPEVRALHPFPDHVGEISLHVAKRSYNPDTKKIIPMYIPQLGEYHVVWEATP